MIADKETDLVLRALLEIIEMLGALVQDREITKQLRQELREACVPCGADREGGAQ